MYVYIAIDDGFNYKKILFIVKDSKKKRDS